MPERKGFKRVDSSAVQGEGSYVEFYNLRLGQAREILRLGDEVADNTEADIDATGQQFTKLMRGWNWVDDEGKPLPLPAEDPAVLESLTLEEWNFLGEQVKAMLSPQQDEDTKKN